MDSYNPLTSPHRPVREELVTILEAARLLGVTGRAIERWISSGLIQRVKLGRASRIRMSDIARIQQNGIKYDNYDRATV